MDIKLSTVIDGDNPKIHDVYLDPTGDLSWVDGIDAIAQHARVRLKFFLNEWFLDRREGIPFWREVFTKIRSEQAIQSIFRAALLGTAGITSLNYMTFVLDPAVRSAEITFEAVTTEGVLSSADFGPFLIEV